MKIKKAVIIILICCITFSICGLNGCIQEKKMTISKPIENETTTALTLSKSLENEVVTTDTKDTIGFFFEDIYSEKKYDVRHSFFTDAIPETVPLQLTLVSQYENGKLYKINSNFAEDFPGRYELGYDRFSLGYFYVNDNNNIIYRIQEDNMTDEIMDSEETVVLAGTVVCQEEEKKDVLGEYEEGLHEWIIADNDRREYHSYNGLTGTGFYEQFIWERGHGLIYYTSGLGAERDMIELTLKNK